MSRLEKPGESLALALEYQVIDFDFGWCSHTRGFTMWLPDTRNQDFNAGRKFYAIDFFIDPLGLDADYRLSKICKTLSRERLHCTYY